MQGKLDKKEKNYIVALAIFVVVYSIRYFEHSMTGYNTTLFAMTYEIPLYYPLTLNVCIISPEVSTIYLNAV